MRPEKFYIGFPPAVLKTTRRGIEYGIGAIPLGGFVKIPGMHRPAPGDVDARLAPAGCRDARSRGPIERLRWALASGRPRCGQDGDRDAPRADRGAESLGRQPESGEQGARRHRGRARPERLLAGGHVEARHRHRRRPARQRRADDRPPDRPLRDNRRQGDDARRRGDTEVARGAQRGLRPATRSSRSTASRDAAGHPAADPGLRRPADRDHRAPRRRPGDARPGGAPARPTASTGSASPCAARACRCRRRRRRRSGSRAR